ncbi:MAG: polyprenyl synthetase family protein [Candidatus Microgenomates bacterium]
MSLSDLVGKYKPLIDSEIAAELGRRLAEAKDISPELVKVVNAMQELSNGGKRMRGLLTILGYNLAQGKEFAGLDHGEGVIKAAMIMELFHLGLLIQDDVMDRDILRRGVATVHARYDDLHTGEAMAICAGDLTFGWGMEMLAMLKLPITNLQIRNAMAVWGRYFSRVGYGQMLDVLKVADEESLMQILALKSGEYSCVLPLEFGATLGGAKPELTKQLTEYGMELGWVFQLRDDYLAEWGESTKTGKPVGNDAREGKHSFVLIYGKKKLETEIVRHTEKAKASLQGKTLKDAKVLEEIVDWVATREN